MPNPSLSGHELIEILNQLPKRPSPLFQLKSYFRFMFKALTAKKKTIFVQLFLPVYLLALLVLINSITVDTTKNLQIDPLDIGSTCRGIRDEFQDELFQCLDLVCINCSSTQKSQLVNIQNRYSLNNPLDKIYIGSVDNWEQFFSLIDFNNQSFFPPNIGSTYSNREVYYVATAVEISNNSEINIYSADYSTPYAQHFGGPFYLAVEHMMTASSAIRSSEAWSPIIPWYEELNYEFNSFPLSNSSKSEIKFTQLSFEGSKTIVYPPPSSSLVTFPFYAILGFSYAIVFHVPALIAEKSIGFSTLLGVMGLKRSIHRLTWLLLFFMFLSVLAIIFTLFCLLIFPLSDPLLMFLMFVSFAFAQACFSLLISSFFNDPKTVAVFLSIYLGIFINILFFLRYLYTLENGFVTFLSSLFFLLPGRETFRVLVLLEYSGIGLNSSSWFLQSSPQVPISIGISCFYLWLDGFFYLFLTWYYEILILNPKIQPFFCLTRAYWKDKFSDYNLLETSIPLSYLDGPQGNILLNIESLSKSFVKSNFLVNFWKSLQGIKSEEENLVVDSLSFSVKKGEIYALLGPNGAGKSTTLKMLTGDLASSSGTAEICGFNLNSPEKFRPFLGSVPQNDVFVPNVSLYDHVLLFAQIKGISAQDFAKVSKSFFQFFDLHSRTESFIEEFSGGQKRKSQIAMAIVGCPQVLFLDEVSAGMAVDSSRAIWDLVSQFAPFCATILTTHNMAEAEFLGDTIGIMNHSKLILSGTPLSLRNTFGIGTRLVIHFSADNPPEITQSSIESISQLVQSHFPDAKIVIDESKPCISLLVNDETRLLPLLQILEVNPFVQSYTKSTSTLEEAFLKVISNDQDSLPDASSSQIDATFLTELQ